MNSDKRWRKYKRNEMLKMVLRTVAIAGVLTIAATSPYFLTNALRQCFKDVDNDKKNKRLARAIDYARRRQLITWSGQHGIIKVLLSEEGKRKVQEYDFDDMALPHKKRHDGKWHVIIFDISDKKKAARNALWFKFKELGMMMLQKSVWVWPYECRAEIKIIQDMYHISDREINYIVADFIEEEKRLCAHFNL